MIRARLLLAALLFLPLDGLYARPADVAQVHSTSAIADPSPTATYPIALPLDDPRCDPGDPTIIVTDCTDYGPPAEATPTPGPPFTYPADCQALWDSGGASLQCPGPPEPTP